MLIRALLLGLLLALGAAIDSAWLSRLALPALPDFVMLVIVVAGVRGGLATGTLLGATGGYLRDLTTGSPLGVFTLTYLVVGVAAGLAMALVDFDRGPAPAAAAAAGSGLVHLVGAAVVAATGLGNVEWEALLQSLVVAAALNAPLARPTDVVVGWIDRISHRRFPEKAIGYRLWR